ncbi:hypothetical protein DPMN_039823 [Dreissena polymorpha]|uniref:Uncharacterized protein n=1 Tax=Dreissena polymorpha TaxID=45954 RepID=A0A9D4CTX8_DREPO|nr:hypothetical protein DPMN_039823 [Dreissena polymorpha]
MSTNFIVDIEAMQYLRYVDGALPGKALPKKKIDNDLEKKEAKKRYEDTRERTFQENWCTDQLPLF